MAQRSKKIRAPSDYFLWAPQEFTECSPEISDFRANGIPGGERVDFFDTLTDGFSFLRNRPHFYIIDKAPFTPLVAPLYQNLPPPPPWL